MDAWGRHTSIRTPLIYVLVIFFKDRADWCEIATPFKNGYNWTYKLTKYSWNMKLKLHGLRELKNPENELHIIASSHIMLEIMFLISIKANLWAKTR